MNPAQIDYRQGNYLFSSDKDLMQWGVVHQWLSAESYWARNVALERVISAGQNSFCVGIFHMEKQIGYARLVTDYTTFGYLADVFVMEEHRKKGLSKLLLKCLFELEWVNGLRRIMLATMDAHGLYQQFGFKAVLKPERFLEINKSL